jgi:hypothetical protein
MKKYYSEEELRRAIPLAFIHPQCTSGEILLHVIYLESDVERKFNELKALGLLTIRTGQPAGSRTNANCLYPIFIKVEEYLRLSQRIIDKMWELGCFHHMNML